MTALSIRPDFSALEIPMDSWSEPFWQAGAEGRVVMPRCVTCDTFRWPAGPFCPECHTQDVDWVEAGQARIYSFTILPVRGADKEAPPDYRVPTLITFDDAPGVRLVSVLVDAPLDRVEIGAEVSVEWVSGANAVVPVFKLRA